MRFRFCRGWDERARLFEGRVASCVTSTVLPTKQQADFCCRDLRDENLKIIERSFYSVALPPSLVFFSLFVALYEQSFVEKIRKR